jgi:integrase/recombinase XerD
VKCIINNQIILSRAPEDPLAAHIGSFARSLNEQGYSLASIQRQVFLGSCFSRWLQQQSVALRGITSDHPLQYLQYRGRQRRPNRGDAAALKHLLEFLRSVEVIPVVRWPRPH